MTKTAQRKTVGRTKPTLGENEAARIWAGSTPAGRGTPAARAYRNDRRDGPTPVAAVEPASKRTKPKGPNRQQRRAHVVGHPISTSPRKAR